MFNKSFWAMKQDLAHGHGVGFSLFGGQGVASGDKQAILDFNSALQKGIKPSKAWATTMSNASISAQNLARSTLHAKGDLAKLANGLQQTTVKSKLASAGLKAMSIAGNMLLSIGISFAIQGIVSAFDSLIHAQEKSKENAQKTQEAFDGMKSNQESLNALIEEYKELKTAGDWDNSARERAREIQEEITRLVGGEIEGLDLVNKGLQENTKELEKQAQLSLPNRQKTAYDNEQAQGKVLWDTAKSGWTKSTAQMSPEEKEYYDKYGYIFDETTKGAGESVQTYPMLYFDNFQDLLWKYDEAQKMLLEMQQNGDGGTGLYQDLNAYITTLQPLVEAWRNAYYEVKKLDAEGDIYNVLNGADGGFGGHLENLEEYKALVEMIKGIWSKPEDSWYLDVVLKVLGEKYPEYAEQARDESVNTANGVTSAFEKIEASSKKVETATEGIATLSKAFKELSDDGYITLESISKIKTAVGDSISNWQEYEQILMTAKVGSTEFNVAMGELTYAILEEKIGLTELANADEAYIARILKENNVTNAVAVAHEYVARAKIEAALAAYDGTEASYEQAASLINECGSADLASQAIIGLKNAQDIYNISNLDVSQKLTALQELGYFLQHDTNLMQALANTSITYSQDHRDGKWKWWVNAWDENGNWLGADEYKGFEFDMPEMPKFSTGGGSKGGGGGGSNKNEALDNFLKDAERAYKIHQDETRYIEDLEKAYKELAKTEEERLEIADKIEEAWQAHADNRIKDIKHEIEMTKNLKGENADVKKSYEEIMTIANEEADRIRTRLSEMGLDSETIEKTNEIQKWQKEWWSAYKELANNDYNISESWIEERNDHNDWDLFGDSELAAWRRVLSRFETEYPELVDKIKDIRKKVSDAMRKEFDDRLELSETYISNQETLGWKAGDNEIAARTRVLEWIQSEYYRSLIESDEEYRDILIENYGKYKDAIDNGLSSSLTSIEEQRDKIVEKLDNENDAIDEQISKEEGLLSVRQKEFDVINKIAEAQHEADKSIATSRISKQYLSDDEYALIFNEEDYEEMTGRYEDIGKDVAKITEDFNKQIEDAYANDQTYLIESITAEYERQMSMKERELEIIQAEYDLKKKEIALENALAEKNVKKFVERDGKVYAEWVADADKVRQATEDFADSQYEFNRLSKEKSQQLELDYKQVSIDNLANMKSANEKQIEMMDEAVEKVSKEIEKLTEPTISLYNAMSMFEAVGVTSLSNAVNDMLDVFSGVTNKKYESIVKPNGLVVKAGSDGWAEGGLPVGTTVETEGGNYLITKVNTDGTYESEKLTPYKVSGYASGIFSAAKGIRQVNENGEETYISPDGIFHNFSGGEPVFNSIQTQNLWKLSKGILPTSLPNITKVPNNNGGVNNTLHGDIIIQNPADFNDFVRKLTRVITQKSNGI